MEKLDSQTCVAPEPDLAGVSALSMFSDGPGEGDKAVGEPVEMGDSPLE